MREIIQVCYITFMPILMFIYVLFNGYPNLVNGTLMSVGALGILYLLVRKDVR